MAGNIVKGMIAITLVTGFAIVKPASAQNLAAAVSPAQKLVTIQVTNVPLRHVLQSIAQQAGLTAVYSDLVSGSEKLVTLYVQNVPAVAAFERALAGTNLTATVVADNVAFGVAAVSRSGIQGSITGKIVHAKTRQPVPGATILLDAATSGITTGADGTFRLSAAAGEHRLTIRVVGFTQQVRTVTVADGKAVTLEVLLEPGASVLDEVIVTGTVVATQRREIPTPITVITGDELERRGITRIEQLFRGEIPGVFAADKGTARYIGSQTSTDDRWTGLGNMVASNVYVRGASNANGYQATPTPLKTYVDGVELVEASQLGMIDPLSIERIEIVTGPQAATIYGSGAMGGVMQIFTKKGVGAQSAEATLRLRYGMLANSISQGLAPTHDHALSINGGIGPQLSYSANLSYSYSGQWQPELFNQRGNGSLGLQLTRGALNISGSADASLGRNGTVSLGLPPALVDRIVDGTWLWPNPRPPEGRTAYNTSQAFRVTARYNVGSFWQTTLTVGRDQTSRSVDPENIKYALPNDSLYAASKSTASRSSVNYNMTFSFQPRGIFANTLTVGADGSTVDQIRLDGCLNEKTSTTYLACANTVLRPYGNDTYSFGGFGSWRIGLFSKIFTTFGVRVERNPSYGSDYKVNWTPSNGITYTADIRSLTIKFLGSYGRATRAPNPTYKQELINDLGATSEPRFYPRQLANPLLGPEFSRGPQGGIEMYFGNRGSLSVNRYKQEITDLIYSIRVDSFERQFIASGTINYVPQFQYVNFAGIRNHGWEFQGSLNAGPLNFRGTYSWNDSRLKQDISSNAWNYYSGQQLYNVPTHMGSMTIGYATQGTTISFVSNWTGRANADFNDFHEQNLDAAVARIKPYITGKLRYDPGSIVQIVKPGYSKSDLVVTHKLTSWVSGTLQVVNVANSFESDENYLWPSLGRQTSLGVNLRFPRSR